MSDERQLDPGLNSGWMKLVEEFLTSAVESDHTRRAYRRALSSGIEWLDKSLNEVTVRDLAAYRGQILARERAPASGQLNLAAWRSFLHWSRMLGAHQLDGDAIRVALKAPRGEVRRPYQVLSDPEVARMLNLCGNVRNIALLAVMLGGGLRVAEVVELDVRDVIEDADGEVLLHIRFGKGKRSRTVPVRSEVSELVKRYLQETQRRLGDDGPLFLAADRAAGARRSHRMSTRAVGFVVQHAVGEAGIVAKSISCHSLRHTYALRALRFSGNVVAVAKLLGHAEISTTQRYVDHLSISELRDVVPPLLMAANHPDSAQ